MSLKEELERELGFPIRVRAGAPGSLRVLVDGEQIYSKKESARPPDIAEIVGLIRGKAASRH